MSMFGKNSASAPANGLFGDIGTVSKGNPKNYLDERAGSYVLEVTEIASGKHENKKSNVYGHPFCRAGFKVLESQALYDDEEPWRGGMVVTTTQTFGGKQADFAKANWRDIACAAMGQDDKAIRWDSLTDEEHAEFAAACQAMIDDPDEYIGRTILCTVSRGKAKESGGYFNNLFFDPAEQ